MWSPRSAGCTPTWATPASKPSPTPQLEGGVTLHGSGIHPGGITERFPLMVSSLSSAVTHVRAEEFSDIRTYNAPDVVRHIMGFGGTPEEAMHGPMASLLESGFKMSVRMIADHMGFRIDPNIRTIQEIAVATSDIDYDPFPITAGTVAARRFRWQALVDGEPVITAAVNWLMGEENLDPDWNFGGRGERFEVEITGDPTVSLTFKGLQPQTIAEGLQRNPGRRGHRQPLRQRHPRRLRRRARHQDLPGPAAVRRAPGSGLAAQTP